MSRRPSGYARTLAALACLYPLLAPPLAHADTCSGLSFNPLPSTTVATAPAAVAVGDFNRDGLMDVVTANANAGSNNITVLLGTTPTGFIEEAFSPFTTGGPPGDLAVGDLDRDGYLDLVVVVGAQIKVMRRLPAGGFDTGAAAFGVGGTPSRIYLADLTRDARLDLIVVSNPANRVFSLQGAGLTFPTSLAVIDESPAFGPEQPSAATTADFNRDGKLDLAVSWESSNHVLLYFGNGLPAGSFAWTPGPSHVLTAVTGPRDIVAGDVDRDGWPDLVTANAGSGNASVLRNANASFFMQAVTAPPVGAMATRVALVDLDLDGALDLAALDDSGAPHVTAFRGTPSTPPWFEPSVCPSCNVSLPPGAGARGMAIGRFTAAGTADGRPDLVTALSAFDQAWVIQNQSGTPCAGTSFALAPRAYAGWAVPVAVDGPVSTAAADFDRDGRADLAVALENDKKLRLLKNVAGHFADFTPPTSIDVSPEVPAAVATADLDLDGNPDVVVARSGATNTVQVLRGTGTGGLLPPLPTGIKSIGPSPSALVIGDFDGNGLPDVAATSEGTSSVFVYLGDGLGGLAAGLPTGVGAAPRALVAGSFNGDTVLDLAVANSAGDNVSILLGFGNGTFTPAVGSPFAVGQSPQGIAAGKIDADAFTDLVTANNVSGTVSVLRNDGLGVFSVVSTIAVPANPTAVALVDLVSDPAPDLAVTSAGNRTLRVLTNTAGSFGSPSDHSVRNFPRAITPIDADADGRLDLAVPCMNADSVVVLLARPPGPPPLLDAPRIGVGDRPRTLVSADLDRDGDLDLAVASLDDIVSLRENDGNGAFSPFPTPFYPVGRDPESIVAADFNRDGRLDLALNAPGEAPPSLSLLFGSGAPGEFTAQPPVVLAGAVPDDLAVGDFDRDGDLDLAVCDKQNPGGAVRVLTNNGSGVFGLAATVTVLGDKPTAIVAGDFDRDGDLDLAVGDDISANVRILGNDGFGGFTLGLLLALDGTDQSPVSITAGDFDGDGALDLAAAAFVGDRLHAFRNSGTGSFAAPVAFAAPASLQFVTAADVNLDGKPDLAAVAAGLVALRGKGGLAFEVPETWVAGQVPLSAAIGDFNHDGRQDAAVVNEGSDDVSLLLSTTCMPRRLEVTLQPLTCSAGPTFGDVVVEARDDGGNLAVCSSPTARVVPMIAPGTGEPGALLMGAPVPAGLPLTNGIASFSAGNVLSINLAGRRYRLQFTLADTPPLNLPPALSRSFTLGAPTTIQILGPSSFCAPGMASYAIADPPDRWDTYKWTLDGPPGAPVSFSPTALLSTTNPLVTLGDHTLRLTTQIDSCSATALPRSLHVGDLQSVSLSILGVSTVCVDCLGGSAKAVELGGGNVTTRQWGYRPASGTPPYIDLSGETGETYTLKGASFPGPGTYYVVVTSTSACGPTQKTSSEWMVQVTDSVPGDEVKYLAAASRGNVGQGGINRLMWVNASGSIDEILIRWNKAADNSNACVPPPDRFAPVSGQQSFLTPVPSFYQQTGLVFDTAYCYSLFVRTATTTWSAGRTVKARPFNADPPSQVKWAYATGGTAVTPPTVSGPAIIAMSNDRTVHALVRGSSGGEWPGGWVPTELMGVAHSRSPVVPFTTPMNGSSTVLFAADEMGWLHAIDASTGVRPWLAQGPSLKMTGAPGGMFTQFGGIRNLLFAGTRDGNVDNALRALKIENGPPTLVVVDTYMGAGSPGAIGPINGSPTIDYATKRVYFASHQRTGGDTLWCLNILPSPPDTPVFSYDWSRNLGNITGSPVLRGGRVYIANDAGTVYSLDALDPDTGPRTYPLPALEAPVKGFLLPDRRPGSDNLIFATETSVWSLSDDGAPMTLNWQWTDGLNPSIVLQWPGTNLVYVGGPNGTLYQLDTQFLPGHPSFAKSLVLGGLPGQGQIGAPSLDIGGAGPTKFLIVGSEPGVLYGVEVPFVP